MPQQLGRKCAARMRAAELFDIGIRRYRRGTHKARAVAAFHRKRCRAISCCAAIASRDATCKMRLPVKLRMVDAARRPPVLR